MTLATSKKTKGTPQFEREVGGTMAADRRFISDDATSPRYEVGQERKLTTRTRATGVLRKKHHDQWFNRSLLGSRSTTFETARTKNLLGDSPQKAVTFCPRVQLLTSAISKGGDFTELVSSFVSSLECPTRPLCLDACP